MAQDLTCLSDVELIVSLKTLVRDERRRLVSVLRHLAEADRRRLADKQGFPSLFDYCVRELRYAEGEAARRIHAARAAAKYPMVYRAIDRGLLSLTTVSLLAPHLSWDNYRQVLRAALGRNKRDVERLVATLAPAGERPERVRFVAPAVAAAVPAANGASDTATGREAARAAADGAGARAPSLWPDEASDSLPLGSRDERIDPRTSGPPAGGPAGNRVEFTFTADEALLEAVERAKELLRHKYARPGYEEVFVEAVRTLLDRIDPGRRAQSRSRGAAGRPAQAAGAEGRGLRRAAASGAIPRSIREDVWRRDGGRCAFAGPDGRRCTATGALEYDHIRPRALGGRGDDPCNVRLLCKRHNSLEARLAFGDAVVDEAIARARRRARGGLFDPPDPRPRVS